MDDWFTVTNIDEDTFIISENKHWEETHCYLICCQHYAALIDTGLGVTNIKQITDKLTKLPILVLTTHAHWDHIGSHRFFPNIAVHDKEKEWLSGNFPLPLEVVKQNLTLKPCDFPPSFNLENYHIFEGSPQKILYDGESIYLGHRLLKVIHTPGHSPGHCCFYEPERKYLYSGDLIYKGCLDAFYPTTDPQQFLNSLEKIQSLKIDKIFPDHHSLDIPITMRSDIYQAFKKLENNQQLKQGNGIFEFGDFQIHL